LFLRPGFFNAKSGLDFLLLTVISKEDPLRKGLSFLAQSACQSLTAALLFACAGTVAAQTAGTADEVPAIGRAIAALIKTRHFYEAEALANKGLALCDTAPGAKGLCVGQFNDSLGDIAYLQKDYSRSLDFFQKAVEARERILDGESALIFASQVRLGRTYLALNRVDEAEPLLKKAIAGLNRAAPLSSNLGVALETLRRLYAANGRIDEGVGVQRSELEFHEKAEGGNVQRIQRWRLSLHDALVRQAKSLSVRKNEVEAERTLLESIKLIDPPPPGAEKYLSVSLEELGILYDRQRRFAEAEPLLLRALEYREKLAGPSDSNLPLALFGLATLYQNWGKQETSLQYALRAVAKFNEVKIQDLNLAVALLKLGQAHGALGQVAEAARSLLRAHDVRQPDDNGSNPGVGKWGIRSRELCRCAQSCGSCPTNPGTHLRARTLCFGRTLDFLGKAGHRAGQAG
jgi:tetratricopeptide (TPR) repeat protein